MEYSDSDDSDAVEEFTKAFMSQSRSKKAKLQPGSRSNHESVRGNMDSVSKKATKVSKPTKRKSSMADETSSESSEGTEMSGSGSDSDSDSNSNSDIQESPLSHKQRKTEIHDKIRKGIKEDRNITTKAKFSGKQLKESKPREQFKATHSASSHQMHKPEKEQAGQHGPNRMRSSSNKGVKDEHTNLHQVTKGEYREESTDDEFSDTSEDEESEQLQHGGGGEGSGSDMSSTGDSSPGDIVSDKHTSPSSQHVSKTTDDLEKEGASDDEFTKLRKELADLPFDELQKLKEKIGLKAYNQAMFGAGKGDTRRKRFTRENKNRPMEISSKVPVKRFREIVPIKKKVIRDPRFDDLSGQYNETFFKQAYSFIGDVKQHEKQKLLKQAKKEKNVEKKKQLEQLIQRMVQQERADQQTETRRSREHTRKKKESVLITEGKKPYYLKNADRKKLELAEKYRELKKTGKLEKYLTKKRKKNAGKDRRKLPHHTMSLVS